jgi:hypothetical protein
MEKRWSQSDVPAPPVLQNLDTPPEKELAQIKELAGQIPCFLTQWHRAPNRYIFICFPQKIAVKATYCHSSVWGLLCITQSTPDPQGRMGSN